MSQTPEKSGKGTALNQKWFLESKFSSYLVFIGIHVMAGKEEIFFSVCQSTLSMPSTPGSVCVKSVCMCTWLSMSL